MSAELETLLRAHIEAAAAWRLYMDPRGSLSAPLRARDDLRAAWVDAEMELAHLLDAPP